MHGTNMKNADTNMSSVKREASTTNIKPHINKLSTNKRCQFLENSVIKGVISEHSLNGSLIVDGLFMAS